LPLIVPSWGNTTVTVVYSSVEQKAFEATMNIYSNDPDQRLKTVAVSGSRFAPNYLTFTTPEIYGVDNLRIEVAANTYDAISALQFDVVYPSDQYNPFDGDYSLEPRATGMTVTARQMNDNTLRFFCYYLGGNNIAAGSGKLMTLKLSPKSTVPAGNYGISISNIKMGTAEMADKYAGTNMVSNFTVKDVLPGDVNGDGAVDTQDAIQIVRYYLGKNPTGFNASVADVNSDGNIDTQDAIQIIRTYLNK